MKAQGHGGYGGYRRWGRGGQAWLRELLTLWHLDGSTAEATKKVRDDVVFDFVLGKPGEHREQPKHHGFDLGRGTSGGKMGRFPVYAALAWALQVGEGLQYPVAAHHSFKIHSKCDEPAYCTYSMPDTESWRSSD